MANVDIDMGKVLELAKGKLWSKAELARQADISDSTLYLMETGQRKASELTVAKLAHALDVNECEIVR